MNPENKDSVSLNKYISSTGLCSRREADKLIEAGRVKLNGQVAQKGNRVTDKDIVEVNGKRLDHNQKPEPIYLALNKPTGIICTTDQRVRDNIVDFVNHKERIFPIGRLDVPSEGLILMTNDGDIVNKILRASNRHEKEYIVSVNKPITGQFLKQMASGVPILDTVTRPCKIEKINTKTFKIILTQGLNRQIRRMCAHLGYDVIMLKRVRIMNIQLGELQSGQWRQLNAKEIKTLKSLLKSSKSTPQSDGSNI